MTFTYPSHTTKGCVPLSSDAIGISADRLPKGKFCQPVQDNGEAEFQSVRQNTALPHAACVRRTGQRQSKGIQSPGGYPAQCGIQRDSGSRPRGEHSVAGQISGSAARILSASVNREGQSTLFGALPCFVYRSNGCICIPWAASSTAWGISSKWATREVGFFSGSSCP